MLTGEQYLDTCEGHTFHACVRGTICDDGRVYRSCLFLENRRGAVIQQNSFTVKNGDHCVGRLATAMVDLGHRVHIPEGPGQVTRGHDIGFIQRTFRIP